MERRTRLAKVMVGRQVALEELEKRDPLGGVVFPCEAGGEAMEQQHVKPLARQGQGHGGAQTVLGQEMVGYVEDEFGGQSQRRLWGIRPGVQPRGPDCPREK